jgi:UDP-glucose 4-epimerase
MGLAVTVTHSTTILVTGGAGFMGSHVVEAVLADSELGASRVIVLDDLTGGARENLLHDERVELVEGSIADGALVENLFRRHAFRFVYHLAAYAAEGLSHFIRHFNYTNNLLGSVNLINSAVRHQAECFVFTSSIAVYGDSPAPLREAMPPRPIDPYGVAKYAVELDLAAAHDMFGLDFVTFRPHNVYGERQHLGDAYRNVVGIFMNRLLSGRRMPVFGDGSQRRALTYIQEVARVIARSPLVPAARNEAFNLGSDESCSVGELAVRVAAALGLPADVEYLPARREAHAAYCDHAKLRAVFPEVRQTPLDDGLRRMAAWARTAAIRPGRVFGPLEIERNLPLSWQALSVASR